MRGQFLWVSVIVAVGICDSARANLTAYAVPSTPSSSTWMSIDSGWTGPFNLLSDPFVTYQTASTPSGLRWQMWGSTDTSVIPSVLHGASVSRTLNSEFAQGQTFRFGLDANSGSVRLVDLAPNNSFTQAIVFGADGSSFGYSDAGGSFSTATPNGSAVDVQLTWDDPTTGEYHGQMSVIGSASSPFTWTGQFQSSPPPSGSDSTNHINGFLATNAGQSASEYFGLRYIEVGFGPLPDPSTLVPEPQLVALFSLGLGMLVRRRR